jgi:hypothetical protein
MSIFIPSPIDPPPTKTFVWDTGTLAWVPMTQPGAGPGGGLTNSELRATPVPVEASIDTTGLATDTGQTTGNASLATIAATDFATQTTLALIKAKTDNLDVALSTRSKPADQQHVIVDSSATVGVTGPLTDTQLRTAAVPVSLASVPTHGVTGAFWQVTQPVSGAFWQATQPVSGTFWQTTQPVSAASLPLPAGAATETTLAAASGKLPATLGQKNSAASMSVVLASDQATVPVSMAAAAATFKGRVSTFRTPGRAGTAGQKILSLHNATGSAVVVTVNKVIVDLACTVVKAITVLPPVIRLWKVTVLPTNGTALTKNKIGGSGASSASVTVLGDASADGTGSGTTLTATLPAGAIVTQEFAPRFVTAAAYEPADRIEFLGDTTVTLGALEGLVLFLDYTLATQNPTTDMWIAGIEWSEV